MLAALNGPLLGLSTYCHSPTHHKNRDLKQLGRQRQGRLRLKNEFLPLIRMSKMASCVYCLIRRHTSTSAQV